MSHGRHGACNQHEQATIGFGEGIGRYGNTQHEVVLEVKRLHIDCAWGVGGYSSDARKLATYVHGPNVSVDDVGQLEAMLLDSGQKLGPRWIYDARKDRVIAKLIDKVQDLKQRA